MKRAIVIIGVAVVGARLTLALLDFFGVFATDSSTFSLTINPGYQCYDGQDNDNDGLEDYPADTGCDSYTDDSEDEAVISSGGGGSGVSSVYHTPTTGSFATGTSAFIGRTVPNAVVRILLDGVEVETARTDALGYFSSRIERLGDGRHVFSLLVLTDIGTSQAVTLPLLRVGNEQTETTNLTIPPIVVANVSTVKRGETFRVRGLSTPDTLIRIEVHSVAERTFVVTTDAGGRFSLDISTEDLELGRHTILASSYVNGAWGDVSFPWTFEVGEETVLITEERPAFCRADVNRDGRVNVVDFSVLNAWFEKPLSGEMEEIDRNCFNGDGMITPADFSILAYYWTG